MWRALRRRPENMLWSFSAPLRVFHRSSQTRATTGPPPATRQECAPRTLRELTPKPTSSPNPGPVPAFAPLFYSVHRAGSSRLHPARAATRLACARAAPHRTASSRRPRPQSDNTNRTCQTSMRPSLTRARRGLSHAACCTCKGARARTQHGPRSADTLHVTGPMGATAHWAHAQVLV